MPARSDPDVAVLDDDVAGGAPGTVLRCPNFFHNCIRGRINTSNRIGAVPASFGSCDPYCAIADGNALRRPAYWDSGNDRVRLWIDPGHRLIASVDYPYGP